MAGVGDAVERGAGDGVGHQLGGVAADVVVLAQQNQRRHLDPLEGAAHAEHRGTLGQHLGEGVAQADQRRPADQPSHVAPRARATVGVDLEQFAAQHVGDELVPARACGETEPAASEPLVAPGVVRPRPHVGQDEVGDPVRPGRGQRQRWAPAHGEPYHGDPVELQGIDEAEEIAGEMPGRVARGVLRSVREAVATLVVGEHRVAVRQMPPLVHPHPLPAGKSVQQDDGRSLAHATVGDLDVADPDTCGGYTHCSNLLPNLFMHQDSRGDAKMAPR